jgi:hypothetical protein
MLALVYANDAAPRSAVRAAKKIAPPAAAEAPFNRRPLNSFAQGRSMKRALFETSATTAAVITVIVALTLLRHSLGLP